MAVRGETVHDPALAATRTTLAWQRSIVLVAATAASLAKVAISDDQGVLGLAVGAGLLLVAGVLYLTRGRRQAQPGADDRQRRPALWSLTALAVVAGVCSLSVTVLIHA